MQIHGIRPCLTAPKGPKLSHQWAMMHVSNLQWAGKLLGPGDLGQLVNPVHSGPIPFRYAHDSTG
jgi:hypothetical protein